MFCYLSWVISIYYFSALSFKSRIISLSCFSISSCLFLRNSSSSTSIWTELDSSFSASYTVCCAVFCPTVTFSGTLCSCSIGVGSSEYKHTYKRIVHSSFFLPCFSFGKKNDFSMHAPERQTLYHERAWIQKRRSRAADTQLQS